MTSPTINLRKAVTLEIGALKQPVVTLYELSVIINKLYKAGSYKGSELTNIKKNRANRSDCVRVIGGLLDIGIIEEGVALRHPEVFSILGREQSPSLEIICVVDPFAYVSHLSAMEWHGLTDRISHTLFYSSPTPKNWQHHALSKMEKDLGTRGVKSYLANGLPRLKRLNFDKVNRAPTHRYLSNHLGAFISIRKSVLRVSTIGRTFHDMLREPELCGGIYHVLDIFEEFSSKYLILIVDEIDRHGTQIDKVRAGYILEERLNLSEPRIDKWREYIQRGGSRKLHAKSPYSAEYSKNWSISLNI